ncbi:hypothetical protein KC357_g4721 [Hortaea werneckii]|nr:hypothetical protein KC351_g12812 [Hortaea werneckii]KAI7476508.1 hypothetical protein KC357_g4721 [Hortaea werneckii]
MPQSRSGDPLRAPPALRDTSDELEDCQKGHLAFMPQGQQQWCRRYPLQVLEAWRRLYATGEVNNAGPSLHPSDVLQSARAWNNGLLVDRVISTETHTPIPPAVTQRQTDSRIGPDPGMQHERPRGRSMQSPFSRGGIQDSACDTLPKQDFQEEPSDGAHILASLSWPSTLLRTSRPSRTSWDLNVVGAFSTWRGDRHPGYPALREPHKLRASWDGLLPETLDAQTSVLLSLCSSMRVRISNTEECKSSSSRA